MRLLRSEKIYKMDRKTASRTLQNVFEASNTAPNRVPFDKIVLRTIANTTMVRICKWIAVAMLILVLISPLAFLENDNFEVSNLRAATQVSVVDHEMYDGYFEMKLSGDTIDYSGIYCKKTDGTIVLPTLSDKESHIVRIPFDKDELNIYIPCTDGKVVQAILAQ